MKKQCIGLLCLLFLLYAPSYVSGEDQNDALANAPEKEAEERIQKDGVTVDYSYSSGNQFYSLASEVSIDGASYRLLIDFYVSIINENEREYSITLAKIISEDESLVSSVSGELASNGVISDNSDAIAQFESSLSEFLANNDFDKANIISAMLSKIARKHF